MKTFRLLLAVATLMLAALAPLAAPGDPPLAAPIPIPFVRLVPMPAISPAISPAEPPAVAPVEPDRPRWPDDWPSLDPVGADNGVGQPYARSPRSGIQNMVIGDLDVTVPTAESIVADMVTADALRVPREPRPPAGDSRVIPGTAGELGRYPSGVTDQRFLQPTFDLPGSHRFRVTVRDAPWATPVDGEVELEGNGAGFVNLDIDTRGLAPGTYNGTVVLTCVDHPGTTVEIPIGIDVPHPPQFGAHPGDAQFGGLDAGGQPRPIEDLLDDVIGNIGASAFGQTANGALVVNELRDWQGHIDFVVTTDAPAIGNRAPQPRFGTAPDGDVIAPGEGQYVYSVGTGPIAFLFASEEFFLGIDQSSKGIDEARQRPGDFYVFTHEGKMGVISKADLAHTLPHEGLHAYHGGDHNVGGGASVEEETDAFRAGNAAATGLGLTPQTDAPGYGASNPAYPSMFPVPIVPTLPAPPAMSFDPPADSPASPVETPAPLNGQPAPDAAPTEPAGPPNGQKPRDVSILDMLRFQNGNSRDDRVIRDIDGLELFVTSRGGSTGQVLDLYIVNNDGEPIRLLGEGIVVEPVDNPSPADISRIDAITQAASAGKPLPPAERPVPGGGVLTSSRVPDVRAANVVRVTLDGYCLDLQSDVPGEGTLFRIAEHERQDANSPARTILASSRRMNAEGRLHPDSDPVAYYHSIRQWAIWVHQEGLDRAGFEEAFVEHTRKNFVAAGRTWTEEVERRVRELAPNRWTDLTAILDGAGIQ